MLQPLRKLLQDRILAVAADTNDERESKSASIFRIQSMKAVEFLIRKAIEPAAGLLLLRVRTQAALARRLAGQIGMGSDKRELLCCVGRAHLADHCIIKRFQRCKGPLPKDSFRHPRGLLENIRQIGNETPFVGCVELFERYATHRFTRSSAPLPPSPDARGANGARYRPAWRPTPGH